MCLSKNPQKMWENPYFPPNCHNTLNFVEFVVLNYYS